MKLKSAREHDHNLFYLKTTTHILKHVEGDKKGNETTFTIKTNPI